MECVGGRGTIAHQLTGLSSKLTYEFSCIFKYITTLGVPTPSSELGPKKWLVEHLLKELRSEWKVESLIPLAKQVFLTCVISVPTNQR
jgi:hypothetical protein